MKHYKTGLTMPFHSVSPCNLSYSIVFLVSAPSYLCSIDYFLIRYDEQHGPLSTHFFRSHLGEWDTPCCTGPSGRAKR